MRIQRTCHSWKPFNAARCQVCCPYSCFSPTRSILLSLLYLYALLLGAWNCSVVLQNSTLFSVQAGEVETFGCSFNPGRWSLCLLHHNKHQKRKRNQICSLILHSCFLSDTYTWKEHRLSGYLPVFTRNLLLVPIGSNRVVFARIVE